MKHLLHFSCLVLLILKSSFAVTKTATITAHCYSFQILPLDWKDGDVTYFTTYDGTSGQPYATSQGGVSSEVKPTTIGSNIYQADFLEIRYGASIDSYGTVSMTIPSTDSDSNGVLDFLQKDKSVNNSVIFNAVVHWDSGGDYESPPGTILFKRSASSNSGTYQITHSDGVNVTSYNYTGTWYISSWTGEVTYDSNYQFSISGTSLSAEGATVKVTGSGEYDYVTDTLYLGGMTLTDGADTIQSKDADLVRNGSTYSGQLSLKDGEVDTSWVDFANWKVFITDTNDYDSDGIPDFTDPESTSSGNSEAETTSYNPPGGWYWFDAYPWVYSSEEVGWLYCYPSSVGLYMYSNKNNAWSLYEPQSQ